MATDEPVWRVRSDRAISRDTVVYAAVPGAVPSRDSSDPHGGCRAQHLLSAPAAGGRLVQPGGTHAPAPAPFQLHASASHGIVRQGGAAVWPNGSHSPALSGTVCGSDRPCPEYAMADRLDLRRALAAGGAGRWGRLRLCHLS